VSYIRTPEVWNRVTSGSLRTSPCPPARTSPLRKLRYAGLGWGERLRDESEEKIIGRGET